MENSSKYFKNEKCEYFPCHKGGTEKFNCLFCYCPLYHYDCPGNYKLIQTKNGGIKSCIDCRFPHVPENYERIMEIIKKNMYSEKG